MLTENKQRARYEGQTIQAIFEAQARQTPDAIALVYQGQQITYDELNGRANRIAHHLRGYGIGKDKLVGLCLERSPEVVVAILAILKAGGAYVPLDPAYPKERLDFIVQDSGLSLVVTREALRSQFASGGLELICVDDKPAEDDPALDQNLEDFTGLDGLAYVIYTSGSTGKPKGVMVTHGNVVRLFQSTEEWFGFGPEDVWTMFHSYAFDFSVWEIWGALFHGGRLVVIPQDVTRSPDSFYGLVRDEKVTVLCQIPYVFYQFMKMDEQVGAGSLPSLRYVIFGGEALNFQRLKSWYERHADSQPQLVNMYGITETTVHVTYRPLKKSDTHASVGSMIGCPIPDLKVYVLDENLHPVQVGVTGEMYVGGAGLARGYLNRPDLDRDRFVPDPFTGGDKRLYRTGDLARVLPDGDMEYIGRLDDQVKIRGFRIELGEIETALGMYPGISDAVVVVREDQQEEKQLVAFYTTSAGAAPEAADLRLFLLGKLPAHMVPSRFVPLKELPVTASGKVDRKTLKAESGEFDHERAFEAPRTATQQTLADIWSGMLSLEKVSIHDNFFELGGHSLLVMQFISRVRNAFGIELPIKVIFDQPVLEDIASWIEKVPPAGAEAVGHPVEIRPASQAERIPLSYPQENIYFIQKLFPACRAYHGRSLVHFKGDLDLHRLEQSLAATIERHEIYRTSFHEENGQTYQVVHPAWSPVLECVDLRPLPPGERHARMLERIARDLQTDFDLARLPLVHWSIYRTSEDEYTLLFVEHHLIHDGWSFNVFLRDWFEFYRALAEGNAPVLPVLPVRFSDFAHAQHEWLNSQQAKDHIEFWRKTMAGCPAVLDLPRDHPRPAVDGFVGSNIRQPLPVSLFASLKKLSQDEFATLFMTMLAAFYVLLYRYTGQEDLIVGTGAANRDGKDLENLTGMLVNTVALRAKLAPETSFRDFLREVRKITLEAYEHQRLPFDRVVEAANPQRSLSHNALFQAMFNFNDTPLETFRLPGISVRLEEGIDNGSAKMDINVIVIPRSEQFVGTAAGDVDDSVILWEYSTALFDRPRIARMVDYYMILLQNIVNHPGRRIADLPILTDEERLRFSADLKPNRDKPKAEIKSDAHPWRYVPPRNRTEARLAEIWQRVLNVERVGVTDNFFELGGHSLLAASLLAEIGKEFGQTLPLHLLFKESTVEALAIHLVQTEAAAQVEGVVSDPAARQRGTAVLHHPRSVYA